MENLRNCTCSDRHTAIWTAEEKEGFNAHKALAPNGGEIAAAAQPSFDGCHLRKQEPIPYMAASGAKGLWHYMGDKAEEESVGQQLQREGRKSSLAWCHNPECWTTSAQCQTNAFLWALPPLSSSDNLILQSVPLS